MATPYGDWEPVIGLEVHAQLLTRTKLFCGCETSFGDPPNTHVCPVCLGLPGALPVPSSGAVEQAVAAALALGCTIESRSTFARKNYFYPDLPKGYQISQYERPFSRDGVLAIEVQGERVAVRIRRIHMEEDAGKNLHGVGASSLVDLNRAGTPLIEIVSEPDIRTPAQAAEYMRRLREVLMAVGVNDGNLEQGSFRCDANVSIRPVGDTGLGVRVEIKNVNSFRFVEDAIDVEIRRQIAMRESGQRLRQATRGYNAEKRETYVLRDKEDDAGYRYFPDPDLPELAIDESLLSRARLRLPELPEARRARYRTELEIPAAAALVLTSHPRITGFFEETLLLCPRGLEPVRIANYLISEVLRDTKTSGLDAVFPLSPRQVVDLLELVQKGAISGKQAKEVHAKLVGTSRAPADVVAELGLVVLSDPAELERLARELITANPKPAAQYRAGKTGMLGFFVGQIMKATKGSADPALANDILKRLLSEGSS
ncbi:MAG: Asp-tRNA(Asn)/Glu-tRNA(Gln) amidotransferase subunit GatB [Polyangiaceae bacterium]